MLYGTHCTLTYSVSIAMTVSKGKYHTLSSYALRDTLYPYIQCIPLPCQFIEANIILSRLMLYGTPCTLTYSESHWNTIWKKQISLLVFFRFVCFAGHDATLIFVTVVVVVYYILYISIQWTRKFIFKCKLLTPKHILSM